MKQNGKRQSLLYRIFTCLFILSVAVSVIPSNSIGVRGFFGEITSVAVQTENVKIVKYNHKSNLMIGQEPQSQKQKDIILKFIMTEREWLLLLAILILICYKSYSYSLPNAWNLISYKVRLDD